MNENILSSRYFRSGPVVLAAEGLVKNYGTRTVVKGVSFEVHAGEVVGLLGPNGAGKTTSFRMTCGLIPANAGRVRLNDCDVTDWPMYRRAREGKMSYLPQDRSVFGTLSTEKNLYLAMELLGMSRAVQKKRCAELLDKFFLTKVRRTIVGNGGTGGLSGGERRRLEIARSLLSEPRILLLDEPFANVDPKTITEIQNVVRELSDEGIAILITDHQIDATMEIADYCYVIAEGAVLTNGTPTDVLANEEARTRYFGEKSEQQLENLKKKIAQGGKRRVRTSEPFAGGDSDEQTEPTERSERRLSLRRDPSGKRPLKGMRRGGTGFTVDDAEEMEDVSFQVDDAEPEAKPLFRPKKGSLSRQETSRSERLREKEKLYEEYFDSEEILPPTENPPRRTKPKP